MVKAETIRAATALLDAPLTEVSDLSDTGLVALQAALGSLTRVVQRHTAAAAGEVARRSSHQLGYAGLAQASGHRTAQDFIQAVSGMSAPEASRLVAVGSLPADSPLGAGVTSGLLSVDAADAIRRGLGTPDTGTSRESLDSVAAHILAESAGRTPEALYRAARAARDDLDVAGIAARERSRRDGRYLRIRQREDGMVTGSFALDQEEGHLLVSAMHTILAPRRGGPRFVSESERTRADAIIADPRSNDQLAADTFADLIRLAVDADPGHLFGSHRPGVQVVVTAADLATGIGSGRIDGTPEAIPIDTVRRHACANGLIGILFSPDGQPLDVGRTQRLFTSRQRLALSARDGGCRFPDCARPPSYCEAHHIDHWHRDSGATDVQDGVLLCRHHHMLIHNNGWSIRRTGGDYVLVPPETLDPARTPIPMPAKRVLGRPLVSA